MKLFISYACNSIKQFFMLIALSVFSASTFAITINENFEELGGFLDQRNGLTNFNVGTANFSGGMSGIARIGELYNSGNHAWMVKGGETGIIQFGADTTEVSFFAKAFSGSDGTSVITAFDNANQIIDSLTLTGADLFTQFAVTGLIDRIEFINNDSDNTRMNSLDDFSVTTVPIPATFWLFASAFLGAMRFTKKP